jgi:hypothetical protein
LALSENDLTIGSGFSRSSVILMLALAKYFSVLDAARLRDRANAEIQMAQAASQHF